MQTHVVRRTVGIVASLFVASCSLLLGSSSDYSGGGSSTNDGGDRDGTTVDGAAAESSDDDDVRVGDGGAGDSTTAVDGGSGLSAGDIRLYYARTLGDLWSRTWSHAAKSWAEPVMMAGPSGDTRVPWVTPTIGVGGVETVTALIAGPDGGTLKTFGGLGGGGPLLSELDSKNVIAGARVAHRGYDVARGAASGSVMFVYADGTNAPKFRVRGSGPSGTWSAEQTVTAGLGLGAVDWIKLTSHPTTNEITLLYSDTSQKLSAVVWNGTSWDATAATTLDQTALNNPSFAAFTAAYESVSGELLVIWSHVSGCVGPNETLLFSTKASGSSTFAAAQKTPTTAGLIASPGPMSATSEPGTDRIVLSAYEYADCCFNAGCNDWSAGIWNGSQWAAASLKDLDEAPGTSYQTHTGTMPVAAGWLGTTGVAVYSHAGGTLGWAKWEGTAWALQPPATLAPSLSTQVSYAMTSVPPSSATGGKNDLVLFIEDGNGSIWSKKYDGTSWTDMNLSNPVAQGVRADDGVAFGIVVGR